MVAPPPNKPATPAAPTYPRPPLLGSPVKNRWGVGKLSTKPGEVYIGGMGGAVKNVPLSVFSNPGARAGLSVPAAKKLYSDAQKYYNLEYVPDSYLDGFLNEAAQKAYAVQQSTGLLVDPLSYMDYATTTGSFTAKGDASAAQGAGGGGGGISKSVNESVNLSDPSTARGLIDSALGQYLGRNPTDKEYANFTAALNAAQKKNPTVTESVGVSGGGMSRTKSVTKGGINEGQFAKEYAQSQEGVAELSAATTGLDAFLSAIGGV